MPHCDACGAFVSRDYHRVFCDRDGSLSDCPECNTGVGHTGGTDGYLVGVRPDEFDDLVGLCD